MPRIQTRRTPAITLSTAIAVATLAAPAALVAAPATAQQDDADTIRLKRENLAKMLRPISLSVDEQPLQDVMRFLEDFTGAQLDVRYINDRTGSGLDPESPISLDVQNISALRLLELVLDQAGRDSFEGATWQLTSWGAIEAGLKSTLNRRQRVQVYDIADLLLVLPDYQDAPEIDLQSVLQSQQGGGGGQSPFGGDTQGQDDEERDLEERKDAIIDLITAIVETEQWQRNGGDGGTISVYQNTLIIRAADYMHRQIDGYRFWPSRYQAASGVGASRYVTFTLDTGIGTVDGFAQQRVTATTGGGGGG
ncbi:MAG: hypothetical protein AAF937_11460 [Planctomycetota bacterium]